MKSQREYTKLIAEFMELKVIYSPEFDEYGIDGEPMEGYAYHDDWNLLMAVVGKIERLGYFCMINKWTSVYTGTDGERVQITTVEGNSKIINTWMAVIQFITWYNKQ